LGGTSPQLTLLYDDGAHDDAAAGDGIYGNRLLLGDALGQQEIEFEASGMVFGSFPFLRTPHATRTVTGGLAAGPRTSYSNGGAAQPIPDRATITSSIQIPDSTTIADLDVRLDITHTYDGDLTATLIAPGGQRTTLLNRIGGSGNNFTGTILDSQAALPLTSGAAPFSGRFRPAGDLNGLAGLSAAGVWTLEISDQASGDAGSLTGWSLEIAAPATPAVFSVLDDGVLRTGGEPFGFGIVSVGARAPTRWVSIRNDGQLPLAVSGIRLPAGFELTSSPLGEIAPGATKEIGLQIDTNSTGHYHGSSEFLAATAGTTSTVHELALMGSVVPVGSNLWQNFLGANDVNADGLISPLDALLIFNELNSVGAHALTFPPPTRGLPTFVDVSGDGQLAPLDALLVVNWLNHSLATPEGEEAPTLSLAGGEFAIPWLDVDIAPAGSQPAVMEMASAPTNGRSTVRQIVPIPRPIASAAKALPTEEDRIAAHDAFFAEFSAGEWPLSFASQRFHSDLEGRRSTP
jgi:subtilisin-like proprotein convertase family protein